MKKETIITVLVVIIVIIIAVVGYNHYKTTNPELVPDTTQTTPDTSAPAATNTVSITESTIAEANYTGTKPVITGSGALAAAAQKYINDSVADFASEANKEVPALRAQYGTEAPPANFTIDINATKVDSATTSSIVIDSYVYMGGANGSSLYKAYTAKDGKVLTIKDVVKSDKQSAFVSYVKKQLLADSNFGQSLFTEDVQKLTITSFANFALDDKNMTIYFDKYQIGPGALGAVAFPISRASAAQYLAL